MDMIQQFTRLKVQLDPMKFKQSTKKIDKPFTVNNYQQLFDIEANNYTLSSVL